MTGLPRLPRWLLEGLADRWGCTLAEVQAMPPDLRRLMREALADHLDGDEMGYRLDGEKTE